MDVTLVSFETSNFRFQVIAASEAEGRAALRTAWRKHARQTGADPSYLLDFADDVNVVTVPLGTVLRDGQPFG